MPAAEPATPGADVGHVGQLQHPLDRPVLAVGTVEHGKDHIKTLSRPSSRAGRRVRPTVISPGSVGSGQKAAGVTRGAALL